MLLSTICYLSIVVQVGGGTASPRQPDDAVLRQSLVRGAARAPRAEASASAIADGLEDVDARVRYTAASALAEIFTGIDAGRYKLADTHLTEARVIDALVSVLDDGDFRVRGEALVALMRIKPDAASVSLLVKRFDLETDARVRGALVSQLRQQAPGEDVARALSVRALDDLDPAVRRSAASFVALFSPPAALKRIVSELRSQDVGTRPEFIHALASYGAAARPYLDVLTGLLANEQSPARSAQLEAAIRQIQAGK